MLLKTAAAVAALALAAGSAHASVTFLSYGTGLPTGESLVSDFDNPLSLASGYNLTGDAQLITGTSGSSAAPAFGPSSFDLTQYLSVEGGESATLTTPLIDSFSLYVGSLDSYNSITFSGPGGTTTYTGTQLGAISGADNGNQSGANTNGRFVFHFSSPIDKVVLSSTTDSFEISDIAAGVPEPATWAMMLIGLGGLGAGLRMLRRSETAPAKA